ncbi:MAG TPA: PaaI family thioesterase [Candidatus Limnocylindrales bacterium]
MTSDLETRSPRAPRGRAASTAGVAGAALSADRDARELRIEVEPHNCFACGSLNADGLQLQLHVDGERCWTELELPARFQGWDGIAHGGVLCTILDEVMAWSLAATENWGLTAKLAVDFKKPVRIGVPIRADGWITSSRRRLIETAATITGTDGTLLATASATYVAADDARRRELQDRYRFRLVDDGARPIAAPRAARGS